ncbi:Protein ENHANCED DISEASE RESISTANCE 4 [Heracleum sosnowskyi]|uniref:Protein ENHANCED DISEASE RESISTANCE 4 n=1 Tax=Heracleum sosnowskyi TaxID=360622 RepID=A0AAD8HCW6_9APIA|nr:Protein ENHANCED DISEASE RESISTANCE 4 [Heracleum sosnowskyi]
MSEQRHVRLVRCPNCNNLLSDYSVFQCAACGFVLRVKDNNFEVDGVSGDFLLGDDGSIDDVRSNGSFASMNRRMEISDEMHERHVYSSRGRGDRRSFEYEGGMDENVAGSSKEFGGSRYGVGLGYGSHRSDRRFDQRSGERGENEYFRGTQRGDVGRVRYSSSVHSYEGPSDLGRNYDYVETAQFVKSRSDFAEFKKVDYVEQEKAEILRKLNELKDQLSRIDVASKPKEKVPTDRTVFHRDAYSNPEIWSSDQSGGQKRTSMQYSGSDKYVAGPSHTSHYNEPLSYMDSREMVARKFYPTMHTPNQIQEFEDPSRAPVLRGPSYGVRPPSPQQYPHPYHSAQYVNGDMATLNTIKPYSHNINMHTPSCSCLQCYNKHPQVLPTITSSAYGDRRYLDDPNNPMSYPRDKPSALGPQDYDSRFMNLPQRNSRNLQWSNDQNLGVGVSDQQRYPKVAPSSGGRRCYPIAGGAPLFACCSCFELLQLPGKFLYTQKSQKKIRCAACSTLIFVEVADKKLILSLYEEAKKIPATDDDSSDNSASSTYDIHLADRKQVSASPEKVLSSNQSAGAKSEHSTSSLTSEDEDNKNTLSSTNIQSNSAELPTEAIPPRPPSGSPLKDHIDYSNRYTLANQSENESKNDLSEQQMKMPAKVISRQNSGRDSAAATELDISSNEYFNTGTSIESGDISREEDKTRAKKGSPFFPDIIRESFQDRSGDSFEDEITNVTVNGNPIPNRLVKKAEKFAGLIQPGEYWYDSRAGFWGVVGGPCLGIIPPSIEEFNFPMPKTCAGGDTGVFVNGRELHQKDLKLLGKRGLPTYTDRSYIIEISGRVLDEESGEELNSLGKLAPTVEKTKQGFGMRTPRSAR